MYNISIFFFGIYTRKSSENQLLEDEFPSEQNFPACHIPPQQVSSIFGLWSLLQVVKMAPESEAPGVSYVKK